MNPQDWQNAFNNYPGINDLVNTYGFNNVMSGNYSTGQGGRTAQEREFYRKNEKAFKAQFNEEKQYETQKTESALKQRQLDYQNYLVNQGEKFQEEKTGQDQSAADQGVLFSGGRYQKLQNLQKSYDRDQAYQQSRMAGDIGNIARDYQYSYGDKAAKGLSQYYNLGGNTYNPNVATGGVGYGGLSSVYNTRNSNFYGTKPRQFQSNVSQLTALQLANQRNKTTAGGARTSL